MRCAECRKWLGGTGRRLARDLEEHCPACECEQHSVGDGSPGIVQNGETLYRMFVDPVDVDSDGRLARAAFSKAYEDGLSILRERANDAEVEALAIDILSTKPGKPTKKVLAIFRFVCVSVRQEMIVYNNACVRAFCVYDQTVPRIFEQGLAPVPTHGIVLARRMYVPPVTARQFEHDCNVTLHRLIAAERIEVADFRDGLIHRLNERSAAGEFVRAA
ncbi:hypothetical protein SAMN05216525_11150 [Bradyrhizobium sp. Gha]|nr:hypothetical protein SAMN05216525_11150 [Bradyrhizobium sp. Gha]